MAVRKLSFKILALIAVLSLVIPSAVTAADAVCSSTCDCCKQAKNGGSCHAVSSVSSPHHTHGDIPSVFRDGGHYDPFTDLTNPSTICYESIASVPCRITAAGDLDDYKGPAPTVRLAERSQTVPPVLITSDILQGDQSLFGTILRDFIPSKFAQVPLYLQIQSILC